MLLTNAATQKNTTRDSSTWSYPGIHISQVIRIVGLSFSIDKKLEDAFCSRQPRHEENKTVIDAAVIWPPTINHGKHSTSISNYFNLTHCFWSTLLPSTLLIAQSESTVNAALSVIKSMWFFIQLVSLASPIEMNLSLPEDNWRLLEHEYGIHWKI